MNKQTLCAHVKANIDDKNICFQLAMILYLSYKSSRVPLLNVTHSLSLEGVELTPLLIQGRANHFVNCYAFAGLYQLFRVRRVCINDISFWGRVISQQPRVANTFRMSKSGTEFSRVRSALAPFLISFTNFSFKNPY